jgi:hypothetical protein
MFPKFPNVFLKMLPIAHHTLYHNFGPKLNKLYRGWSKEGMSTNMFWKCGLLLWVGVVQTSKFYIFCFFFKSRKKFRFFLGNNLGCISQLLHRTNNKWPKLVPMAGYWWFYNGPNIIRGMLFLVPLHPFICFGCRKWYELRRASLTQCKSLSNIFVGHQF